MNASKFFVWKFRTTYTDNPGLTQQVTAEDPRVCTIGCWLRQGSLDELPQF
jgi:lipopolysaccharide/colanic/teichoic acid biosynthesis glycosyltransferase